MIDWLMLAAWAIGMILFLVVVVWLVTYYSKKDD